MPKHHILCIHGIGKHSNTWIDDSGEGEKSFKETLKEAWNAYPFLKEKGFDNKIHLESIHYDDEIEKLFASWAEQAAKLNTHLTDSPAAMEDFGWVPDYMDKASEAGAEEDFLYTHLMDLILFWCSPTIQNNLVQHVGEQIVGYVNSVTGNHSTRNDEISIIAHSMGTSMCYKVLQAIYNQKLDSGRTISADFKFNVVALVSNVSFVLSRDPDYHYQAKDTDEVVVKPSVLPQQGVCMRMINANHQLDIPTLIRPFAPPMDTWLDAETKQRECYQDIELKAISAVNVHDITHYLKDPKLNAAFFELLLSRKIPEDQKKNAAQKFAADTAQGSFENLAEELEELKDSRGENYKAFYTALKAFIELIKKFKDEIGD